MWKGATQSKETGLRSHKKPRKMVQAALNTQIWCIKHGGGKFPSFSLVRVSASRTVQKIRYYSSDDHINTLYFRLGVATVIQTDSPDSCHLKRSKCCVSTVAAVTESEVGFHEFILFEDTAVSTLAKLSSESVWNREEIWGGYAIPWRFLLT